MQILAKYVTSPRPTNLRQSAWSFLVGDHVAWRGPKIFCLPQKMPKYAASWLALK